MALRRHFSLGWKQLHVGDAHESLEEAFEGDAVELHGALVALVDDLCRANNAETSVLVCSALRALRALNS
jgi:hypothetical protein